MPPRGVPPAPPRLQAIEAQAKALDAFAIEGIRHNIPFLTALMAHPRWRSAKLSTGFIAEEYKQGFQNPAPQGASAKMLATVAVALDHKLGGRKRQISGQLTGRAVTRAKERRVWLDTTEYTVEIVDESAEAPLVPAGTESAITVRHAGELVALKSAWKPGEPVWSGTVDGAP